MNTQRPTPRVDAETQRLKAVLDAACTEGPWEAPICSVGVEFARELERELAHANEEVTFYSDACDRNAEFLQNLERVTEANHDRLDTVERSLRKAREERDLARERGFDAADVIERRERENGAMRAAIQQANTVIERYSESAISHAAQLMCPECLRIEAFDEEHKDTCSIGTALAALKPFLPETPTK